MSAELVFDEPGAVADRILDGRRPILLGLDVDGVLAPIVSRAGDARLLDGTRELLARLVDVVTVAVVSGRSLHDLETLFGFPEGVIVFGSHGLEPREGGMPALHADEAARLDRLVALAQEARDAAGDGAWLESKPASIVLHTFEADPERGRTAADRLVELAHEVPGAHVKPGKAVVELLARSTSKAHAIAQIAAAHHPAQIVFVGDDRTDEEVFASLGPTDTTIHVGEHETGAQLRLAGPAEVQVLLGRLADRMAS